MTPSQSPNEALRDCAFIQTEQGYDVHVLQNSFLRVAVAPQLGAKVISILNRQTRREWMWHPPGGMKLFGNKLGDDFSISTMTGWDECLPTIAPCSWEGRALPDHGEVWSVPWEYDQKDWEQGILTTRVQLSVSPFRFERTIALRDNVIELNYRLTNLHDKPQAFLWAMHPLISIQEGDNLDLTEEAWNQLADEPWTRTLAFDSAEPAFAKVFAGPLREGRASIVNSRTADRLTYEWDTAVNNTLGLWLTRGGWNGYHHLALEPTNGAPDWLDQAAAANRCASVPPHSTQSWQVALRIDPAHQTT